LTKTIAASALALTFAVAGPAFSSANADTLSTLRNQYAELQQQQQELQQKLNAMDSKVSSANSKKATIAANVKAINTQVELLNKQVKTLNAQIVKTNESIDKTQKDIEENTKLYKQRVCSLYEAGNTSKLQILLSSTSVSDFFMKFETLKVISDHDTALINQLKTDKTKLQSDQKSLQEKQASLEESKGTLAAKQAVVRAQLSEQQRVVSGLQSAADEVASERNAVRTKARETDAQINAEISRLAAIRQQQLAAQGGSSSVSNSYIINYAKGFLGTRYVFGSANPSYGFDCSGFVQYVFANSAGINLPHSAKGMAGKGTAVSKGSLKAGDLVFFATGGGSINHVGIYIGGDQFIAANSGSQMCVSINGLFSNGYWSRCYAGAKRIK
jgi:cell wall-associated NlpC family hydrolase